MNRPSNKPAEKDLRNVSARRTALAVMLVAVAVYITFMIIVWSKHH